MNAVSVVLHLEQACPGRHQPDQGDALLASFQRGEQLILLALDACDQQLLAVKWFGALRRWQ